MDKNNLIKSIEGKGWKKIRQDSEQFEHHFDIIGERWFTLTKWFVLVKFTKKLTKENILQFQNDFKDISKKSKSWIWGKCFLYCIVADNIDASIVNDIEKDSFGLWGVLRMKGGGGNIFLVDSNRKKIYGKVPTLPYDVHKYSKDFMEILNNLI